MLSPNDQFFRLSKLQKIRYLAIYMIDKNILFLDYVHILGQKVGSLYTLKEIFQGSQP